MKPNKPNPMRWRVGCPDCGWFTNEDNNFYRNTLKNGFDCPRCGAHYSVEDWDKEMEAKHMAQHHNHAKADLTQEEL